MKGKFKRTNNQEENGTNLDTQKGNRKKRYLVIENIKQLLKVESQDLADWPYTSMLLAVAVSQIT